MGSPRRRGAPATLAPARGKAFPDEESESLNLHNLGAYTEFKGAEADLEFLQ